MEMGSLHTELRFAATKHVAFLSVEEKYGRAAPEEEGKPARRRRSQALTPDWAGAVYSLARRTEGGRFSPIASEKGGGVRPWPPRGGPHGELCASLHA
jgi:hypothetical protein